MKKLLMITQKVDENDMIFRVFISWINLLAKRLDHLYIICLEKGTYHLPGNVSVFTLGKERGKSKLGQLFNFYNLIFKLRREYDSVFVHMAPIWAALGGLFWRIMGKKLILWYTHRAVTLRLRIAEKFADVILTASKESFRLNSDKVIITGHGIDTDLFRPGEKKHKEKKLLLLTGGRITPSKKYDGLVAICSELASRGIDFRMDIFGEPVLKSDFEYKERIGKKIKDLGLQKNLEFLGKIKHENLPFCYNSHDIFIHISRTGGTDKTILEAMACGIGVLSSSDAPRSFLPGELIFDDSKPGETADKIITTDFSKYTEALRKYVVTNHNLDSLISRIGDIING